MEFSVIFALFGEMPLDFSNDASLFARQNDIFGFLIKFCRSISYFFVLIKREKLFAGYNIVVNYVV